MMVYRKKTETKETFFEKVVAEYVDRFDEPADAGLAFIDGCAGYCLGFVTALLPIVYITAKRVG